MEILRSKSVRGSIAAFAKDRDAAVIIDREGRGGQVLFCIDGVTIPMKPDAAAAVGIALIDSARVLGAAEPLGNETADVLASRFRRRGIAGMLDSLRESFGLVVLVAVVLVGAGGCYASHTAVGVGEPDAGALSDAAPPSDANACPIVANIPIGIRADAGDVCEVGPCFCRYIETPRAIAECTRCDCDGCFRYGGP